MSDFDEQTDPELDAMLSEHLRERLDPQLGAARRAFESQLRTSPLASSRRTAPKRRIWLALSPLAAVAATIAMIVFVKMHSTSPLPPHIDPIEPLAVTPPSEVGSLDETLSWQTVDQGIVFLDDNTPARQVLRRQIQELRWVDA